jgi:hypothetical protein
MHRIGETRPDRTDGVLWTVATVLPDGQLFVVPVSLDQDQSFGHALLAPRRVIGADEFSKWGLFVQA